MIKTIKQNERLYTKRQVEAERRMRIFASAMGAMAMADIIGQVRSWRVDGIDFTVEDVVRAYEREDGQEKSYPSPSQGEDRRFESPPARLLDVPLRSVLPSRVCQAILHAHVQLD
jgi:hypothetical protein